MNLNKIDIQVLTTGDKYAVQLTNNSNYQQCVMIDAYRKDRTKISNTYTMAYDIQILIEPHSVIVTEQFMSPLTIKKMIIHPEDLRTEEQRQQLKYRCLWYPKQPTKDVLTTASSAAEAEKRADALHKEYSLASGKVCSCGMQFCNETNRLREELLVERIMQRTTNDVPTAEEVVHPTKPLVVAEVVPAKYYPTSFGTAPVAMTAEVYKAPILEQGVPVNLTQDQLAMLASRYSSLTQDQLTNLGIRYALTQEQLATLVGRQVRVKGSDE